MNDPDPTIAEQTAIRESVATGIAFLHGLIENFDTSPGVLSAMDQGHLDGIHAAARELLARSKRMAIAVEPGAPRVSPLPPVHETPPVVGPAA